MAGDVDASKSREFYEFKKQLEALKKFRGRGTELISVYMPPGYPVSEVSGKLREEAGQATNIKSTSTRKNVLAALDKIINYLKGFRAPPATGIAIFCGNVSEVEGRPDIELYSIVPPVPIAVQFYRCESIFVLEPLENLVTNTDAYGLVVMDGKEATVAVLQGKQLKIIKNIHSTAHAKTHKGGQSAARFGRLREEGIEFFHTRIAEAMTALLEYKNFKGVVVGGPGPAKEDFLRDAKVHHKIEILGTVDTGYTDEYGIREVIEKSGGIIAEQEAVLEKKRLDDFMRDVVKGGMATYGESQVRNALQTGQAKTLLVSEGLELYEHQLQCGQCGKTRAERSDRQEMEEECECGGKMKPKATRELSAELIEIAENAGIPVEMVSRDSPEGSQFHATFGGIGAFLRYK
ncbi:MAG: peptide chain release factor aRF-1 [Candidatus Micrarchaeota archaeon]|mgnify:CR=1 FL=1